MSDRKAPESAPELIRVAYVSPTFFSILRATPAIGRMPAAADFEFGNPEAVLISHDLWVRRYGADPGIAGRSIELDGRPALVTGVAETGLAFPHPEIDAWIVWSHEAVAGRRGAAARIHSLTLSGVGRLAPGVSIEAAELDIERLVASLPEANGDVTANELEEMGLRAVVTPLEDAIIGDARAALLMLQGADPARGCIGLSCVGARPSRPPRSAAGVAGRHRRGGCVPPQFSAHAAAGS